MDTSIDREYCLDHWSNHKDQLALVALYPEEFAYLLVLKRKCMAIQERVVIAERILPKGGNDNYASLTGDMLAFSFFRTGASYWSVTFDRWYSHILHLSLRKRQEESHDEAEIS